MRKAERSPSCARPVPPEETTMSDEIQVEGEELPHLLLVETMTPFTRVMARAMSRRGFRVSTAGSAEEGLSIAQADLPDYAALDLKMDGDSGLGPAAQAAGTGPGNARADPHRLLEHRHSRRGDQARCLQLPAEAGGRR